MLCLHDMLSSHGTPAAGGAWLADVDAETGLHNLAVPLGHIPSTGMGLPLNGGFGIASRAHGLACHHVLSYTLVTADGSVVCAPHLLVSAQITTTSISAASANQSWPK